MLGQALHRRSKAGKKKEEEKQTTGVGLLPPFFDPPAETAHACMQIYKYIIHISYEKAVAWRSEQMIYGV